jgi:ribokinase
MSIVVFGSLNMDLTVRTPRFPQSGETIIGDTFRTSPGGKGANQAVACARLGASTFMVGRVGEDAFGESLQLELKKAGVHTEYVNIDQESSSGVALITVDQSAENTIIVVPGANGKIDRDDLEILEKALEGATHLLVQLEIPLEMVLEASRIASQSGIAVILDPAPAVDLPKELYQSIDIITPNETEAEILVGFAIRNQQDASRASRILLDRGVKRVVIKMGSEGAFAASDEFEKFYPAIPVKAVDTVAAGDAFNAGMAVALSEGMPFEEAILWGITAGALSVMGEGAQPSMPGRNDLEQMLMKIGEAK